MVVTLIFLVIRVRLDRLALRESNRLWRAAETDEVFNQLKGIRRLVASDSDVARIWLHGRQGELLEPIDELRFKNLAPDYLIIFYNMAQWGVAVGNAEMTAIAVSVAANAINDSPGLARIWSEGLAVSARFRHQVN